MEKKTIKLGLFGLGRGSTFYDCIKLNGGELVAVCDKSEEKLAKAKDELGDKVKTFTDFDEFLEKGGMDAVFLCNYFHEHAPYAIKALNKDIHVLSECTSNGTMAEGVELVRAAEKSKAKYMLSENYPFMTFNREMKRVFEGGSLGKFLYGEGEYNHPADWYNDPACKELRPYPTHWRCLLPRSYYITHSLAPLMYITGAYPVRVTAMPVYQPDLLPPSGEFGFVNDAAAIITCLNNDESVYKVTGCASFGAHSNSYRICGSKGQIENLRGRGEEVMLRYNGWNVPEGMAEVNNYVPDLHDKDQDLIDQAGHGGGDFVIIREFFECIRENRTPVFDVYFATTCASVGILAHRSLLEKGTPIDIPDFRKEEDRAKYENDRISPFYGANGEEPTIAFCSH
ncbi:MAG: Gfo/Idh/MocA family oxidoreductase [Clostridia bacterium]|nr:Gfo/Idh/MocA family oxidoreductase [Clostridia bacterium]